MKKFNLRTGIIVSLINSVPTALLRLLQLHSTDLMLAYYYFVFSLLCWGGNILLINSPLINRPVYKKRLFYFISIVSGGLFALLFDFISNRLHGKTISVNALDLNNDNQRILIVLLRGTLLNVLNAFLVSHIKELKDNEEKLLELEHLKQAQLQANLSSLKEQLSPHFLFNTFNTLSSLTAEQPVKDYVEQMANVYRYLLDYQKNDLADLGQELAFAESYLYIIKTRLETALQISINIGIEALHDKIPPLTLQLLIENAIKHNVASTGRPLKISIFTQDGFLVVANNLQPKNSVQPSSGLGLNNIARRYHILFNKEIKIEMDKDFFTVKLPLNA